MSKVKIVNPAYDISFKFLMEDKEVASILLSDLIGEQIIDLEFKPKEYSIPVKVWDGREMELTIYRLDFKALIRTKEGEQKVVLIEVQRVMLGTEVRRFRRYLGEQYASTENLMPQDAQDYGLPIITIYFLGYLLDEFHDIGVIKIKRRYIDVLREKELNVRSKFVEALTHEMVIVHLPIFKRRTPNSEIEKVLSLFDPSPNTLYLWVDEDQFSVKYKKIIKRLKMAAADVQILRQMEEEDYILLAFKRKDEEIRREREARLHAEREILKVQREKLKAQREKYELARKTARFMKELGYPVDEISRETGLSVDEILKL